MAGIPTRKDSLAAVFISIPENNAEVKVTPDLETPGKIANDCDKPNKIISVNLISLKNSTKSSLQDTITLRTRHPYHL